MTVTRPGGTVAAYAWDIMGGGFTLQPIQTELKAMGFSPVRPPSSEASTIEALQRLWTEAGLVEVRPDGQRRLYRLRTEPFRELDEWLAPYREMWQTSLDKLEDRLSGAPVPRSRRKPR